MTVPDWVWWLAVTWTATSISGGVLIGKAIALSNDQPTRPQPHHNPEEYKP